MLLLLLVATLAAAAGVAVLVERDGLGRRPPPRSHAHEGLGSTWPHAGGWDR